MRRTQLYFLVGLVFVVGLTPLTIPRAPRPRPPRRLLPPPTQGSGAIALISSVAVVKALYTSSPLVFAPDVFYFAATAINNYGLESDFSNEAIFTNDTKPTSTTVNLAWEPSPSTGIIAYVIYRGWETRVYDTRFHVYTNLSATVPLYPPAPTNFVIIVTCTNGCTNLVVGTTLHGPWTKLNTTNYVATNLLSPLFFRGLGKPGNRVLINSKHLN